MSPQDTNTITPSDEPVIEPVSSQTVLSNSPISLEQSFIDDDPNNGAVESNTIAEPIAVHNLRHVMRRFVIGLLAFLIVVGGAVIVLNKNSKTVTLQSGSFKSIHLPLSQYSATNPVTDQKLAVNGQLQVNNSLILTPGTQPSQGTTGQLFFNQSSNQLQYYNGSKFVGVGGGNIQNATVNNTTINGGSTTVNNINNSTTTINGTVDGISTIGGTLNTVPVFNGTNSLGNSIISTVGTDVTIAGNINLVNSSPTSEMTIWPSSTVPDTPNYTLDTNAVEVGTKFQSDVNGIVFGIRFYKGPLNTGTHVGDLWTSSGQLLATVTFTNETASGWQQALFTHGVAISADTTYIISYHMNGGEYASTQHYFAFNGYNNLPLHALQDGNDGGNGVFIYSPTPAFPNHGTVNAANYWVDMVFQPSSNPYFFEVNGAPISSTSLSNNYDLAKRSAGQVFTGINTFRNTIDSSAAFVIQDAASNNLFVANTSADEVDVGQLGVGGDLYIGRHLITQGGKAPGAVGDAAACTNPQVNLTGNDISGVIDVKTGTGCTGPGDLATITFNIPFKNPPHVLLSSADAAASTLSVYVDSFAVKDESFDLQVNSGTINDSTDYRWYYEIIQ